MEFDFSEIQHRVRENNELRKLYASVRFNSALKGNKLTLKDFGQRVDLDFSYISLWLNGKREFPIETLRKVREGLMEILDEIKNKEIDS